MIVLENIWAWNKSNLIDIDHMPDLLNFSLKRKPLMKYQNTLEKMKILSEQKSENDWFIRWNELGVYRLVLSTAE